jgi:L-threonylcarbamoyladenylate synthase
LITKVLNENFHLSLEIAAIAIKSGEVVGIPTDTVYGIGLSAFDQVGIQKLFEIKGRDANKAIAILLSDQSQLVEVCSSIPGYAEKLAVAFWPGALTLVVPRNPTLPENLSILPTVGVRIPDHNFTRNLIRITGPLAVTSANLTGERSSTNIDEVLEHLNGKVGLIIDGGQTNTRVSSTVVDCTSPIYKILRPGMISQEQIQQELN